MATSRRMTEAAPRLLLLLHLGFLVFVLHWSHIHCKGMMNLNNNAGGEGERYDDDATYQSRALLKEARTATNLRAFLQFFLDLLDFPVTSLASGEQNQDESATDFDNEVEVEAPEKFFNTSGARFVYNAENQEEEENVDDNDDAAGNPHLPMPFQRDDPSTCKTGNYIDDCWRCDSNWQDRRQNLASCAIGFGKNALGGKNGKLYIVTTNKDDTENPAAGTLRYGVTRSAPLWIIFANDMTIELEGELVVSSYKTIDGRGARVHIIGRSQITIQRVSNVIIHGIHIHDIVTSGPQKILSSPSRRIHRGKTEGDAIHIRHAHHVWIDHCYLSKAVDGLIDCTKNSTAITISNCNFENHNKVMLLGASPKDEFDRNMQITVAFNKFGAGLTQRMPRCRYGNCHVANNFYTHGWGQYAIGGSQDPTILSQGNQFVALDASNRKEVTKRIDDGGPTFGGWQKWDWTSMGDSFANGAFFTASGVQDANASAYDKARSFVARHASWVPAMTQDAGPLDCVPKTAC